MHRLQKGTVLAFVSCGHTYSLRHILQKTTWHKALIFFNKINKFFYKAVQSMIVGFKLALLWVSG